MQKSSTEHVLNRAKYFAGLLLKTNDPVYWEEEKLRAAQAALYAAKDQGHGHVFTAALAALECAVFKALC